LDALGALFVPPPDVDVRPLELAGVCEQFDPPNSCQGTLLHFHGGAYTAGSLDSHRAMSARLAEACACRVIAVGYRLAPENIPVRLALMMRMASTAIWGPRQMGTSSGNQAARTGRR
jgi:acetyl esterase/lipase